MSRYRVVYSRGSFGFMSLFETHEQALAEAHTLQRTIGVWHIHVEDAQGTKIIGPYDLLPKHALAPQGRPRSAAAPDYARDTLH